MDFIHQIGRFHPLVLHLPIGFLLLAFMMELAKKEGFQKAIGFALQWGMVAAIVAAISGWCLSQEGGYEEEVLIWHQWLGIGTAFLSVVLFLLYQKKQEGKGRAYFPVFMATMLLLITAGHFGGTLTHGNGFLFGEKTAEEAPPAISNLDSAIVFKDFIQPILKEKCTGCHNESKLKGELLLTGREGILKGGKTGPLLIAGDTANSLLLQRLHLPDEEKKHMPPKGKKQPTTEEIKLLAWWIGQGADFEKTVAQTETPESIHAILVKYMAPEKKEGVFALNFQPATASSLRKLQEAGIKVYPLAQGLPWLEASFAGQRPMDMKAIEKLKAVADQLISLDLSRTDAGDEALKTIAGFPHLQTILLQNTAVTDDGLIHLEQLSFLENLNLYGTGISEKSLPVLVSLPRLKNLFLWETNIGQAAISKLQQQHPKLNIELGADEDVFGDAKLKPPAIASEKDIFRDTMSIAFELPFKGATIRYTLDGTEPDSNALVYEKPLLINRSTEVRAFSQKPGWLSSEPVRRFFARANFEINDIALTPQPDERYKGKGGKTLTDFVKGTTNFGSGAWLGYQGRHVLAMLDLGKVETVERVTVGALESDGPWIFYPKGIEISVSADGKNYKPVAKKAYPTATATKPVETNNFSVPFAPTAARFIKVKILSNLRNPPWHPAAGKPCWVFLDEIMVE
ncbi:MAG: chitobiase/beta-hexosaminidase C-terminal domain-containing protein [Lewinellaceae bacterium]|nr:chitobiase/beta-hexosaminidase C-terminal domain-containing protein [Saprospiraceae bacterium]MCB9341257.1 chitobiase/beta-hexosaminidase C-terminal domain-containing protein [Lewinellaceae bacterium]